MVYGVAEILLNLSANSVFYVVSFLLCMFTIIIGGSCYKRDKHVCLLRQNVFHDRHDICRDKDNFVATKTRLLLRQKYACRDKQSFLSASILLSRQQTCFVATNTLLRQTRVCRNKTFVATKMILAAAPVNDTAEDLHVGIVVFI